MGPASRSDVTTCTVAPVFFAPARSACSIGIHAAAELGQERRMDVDDAILESLHESIRVDAVIAGIDDELDALALEEIAHRGIALGGRCEVVSAAARPAECRALAQTPLRHRPDGSSRQRPRRIPFRQGCAGSSLRRKPPPPISSVKLQRIMTRSGAEWRTTSPTTWAPGGTSPRSMTRIMPRPMLKVPEHLVVRDLAALAYQSEDRWLDPGFAVEEGAEAVGQASRQVAEDAATRDVRGALPAHASPAAPGTSGAARAARPRVGGRARDTPCSAARPRTPCAPARSRWCAARSTAGRRWRLPARMAVGSGRRPGSTSPTMNPARS